MRIRMVTRATPLHSLGGMEKMSFDLARLWAASGHDVEVVTTPLPGHVLMPTDLPARLTMQVLPGRTGRYSHRWAAEVAALPSTSVDLVLGVSSAARLLLRGRRPDAPIVMQAHGTSKDEIITKLRSPSVRALARLPRNVAWLGVDMLDYPRYDAVIGVGPAVTSSISSMPRPARPRRYLQIDNGVRLPPQVAAGTSRSGLLFVGRLHREKGIDLALRAMPHLSTHLTICGEGPDRKRLERLARELDVSHRVHFLGRTDSEGVSRLLAGAEGLVVPSRRVEVGLPLTALEGLTHGTPVIASSMVVRGLGDSVPTGVLDAGDNEQSLAAAAQRVLDREAMSDDTIKSAAAAYDIHLTARAYIELFEELTHA